MKLIKFLLLLVLLPALAFAQSESDVNVIPDNQRHDARFIPERRNTDRTSDSSGAGAIWFNSSTRTWKGDLGNGTIFSFSSPDVPTFAAQAANTVFAGPTSGSALTPAFRTLVSLDIPSLDAAKITSGTFNFARIPNLNLVPTGLAAGCAEISGGFLTSTGVACGSGSGGVGTVTSFSAGDLSPLFTTTEATATSTPALSFAPISQSQNLFYASPSGSSGNPSFRAIVLADVPNLASLYQPLDADLTTLGGLAKTDNTVILGNGTTWINALLPSCSNATSSKLLYDNTTRTFSCGTDQSGGAGGTPSGSDKNVQYNNAGAFGGIPNNATATAMYLQQTSSGTPTFAQIAASEISGLSGFYQPLDGDLTAVAGASAFGFWTRTASGSGSNRTFFGTTDQITITNGNGQGGNPVISIPTNPVLPGTTTGTFSGNLTGNASTATALATNPTPCGAGQYVSDIAADGTLTCGTPAGGAGDIEGVTAGTNLTGGGTSGTVTLNVANPVVADLTGNATTATTAVSLSGTVTDANVPDLETLSIGLADGCVTVESNLLTSSGAPCGGATLPTIDELFDADPTPVITGATEAKPFIISGSDPDYGVALYVTTTNSPQTIGKCGGIIGNCDRTFPHNTGKKTSFLDESGNEDIRYTAADGILQAITGQIIATSGDSATGFFSSGTIEAARLPAVVKSVQLTAFDYTTDVTTGTGKAYFRVPSTLNNFILTAAQANVITAGTTGSTTVRLTRCNAVTSGNTCSGTTVNMLTTDIGIETGESDSTSSASPGVIDTVDDDITTGQVIRVDVQTVSTTAPKGLIVNMDFSAP